ncbi:MAG TPA: 2TM domain-containing protein [Aggregatilineales bacterium]|nr:2TM domain-containing protein [Aggregatilineales bacterium]
MNSDDVNYEEIRRRVNQRLNERVEFLTHLAIYINANVALWVIWGLDLRNNPGLSPWPVLITLIWGVALIGHGAKVFSSVAMDRIREHEVDRAVEREKLRRGMMSDKRKNDRAVALRLSDEGEIIPADEADLPAARSKGSKA